MAKPETRPDIYARVTAKIVADLETGVRPWVKPWSAAHAETRVTRPLRHNGEAYRGVNVLVLWAEALARGFACPTWLTFRQALAVGGHVRKGETGSLVVFADRIRRTATNDDEVAREIPFMKSYTVFNVEQIDGLPETYYGSPAPPSASMARIARAETFFQALNAHMRHSGTYAFYAIDADVIGMPPYEAFRSPEDYYCTLGYEHVHRTRHPSRMARDFGRQRRGDAGYAQEELVAEIGAAFLATDLELTLSPREDPASYIAGWLQVLRRDKRAIFVAAAHAQRALDWLHGQQRADAKPRKRAA